MTAVLVETTRGETTAAPGPPPRREGSRLVVDEHNGATLRARVAHRGFRTVARPALALAAGLPLNGLPGIETAERAAAVLRPPRGTRVRRVRLEHCPAEWVIAPGRHRGRHVVLYFHGGAFLACGLRTHRRLVAKISQATGGVPVLNVAYRLLPRATLADAFADALDAYRWLLDRRIPADQIVIGGDSAGAMLAVATAMRARDAGLPVPGGIIGLSPWIDLDFAAKELHSNAALDPLIPIEAAKVLERGIAIGVVDMSLSPVNGDLAGLPPTFMQVGSTELMRCDAELMGERLAAAGVPCHLQIWDGQIHDFQIASDVLPEARAAIAEIARFIRRVTIDPAP